MTKIPSASFHTALESELQYYLPRGPKRFSETTTTKHFVIKEREVAYRLTPHFHPFVAPLVQRLLTRSVRGLQAADTEYVTKDGVIQKLPDGKNRPVLYGDLFSPTRYAPTALVQQPYPVKDLDFTSGGAYSVYNWELFFHVPLTIAMQLSRNQRFADAQKWFHFIFDPTDDSDGPTPERFWKVRPFQYTNVRKIEELLVNLATGDDPALREETVRSIAAWRSAPFRPHVVARYRQQAYMFKTVMAYIDNLVAWGDSLFRQDTGEAIDEAMMLYVLAANILGPRPQAVPSKGKMRPQTYASLRKDLDEFSNAARDFEVEAPFDLLPLPNDDADDGDRTVTIRSLSRALYFSVPRNDRLMGYWDTVADRLFKIRNSLNFQGTFRQLALFEPPFDPAMFARATAAGIDVGAVVNGRNQPLPLVRFTLLVQKAIEICQEVKSLGGALLAAMEKEDGEAIAALRARHERAVLDMTEQVRYTQLQETIKSREALEQTLESATQRYAYFERQLGLKDNDIKVPQMEPLDTKLLEKEKFESQEPEIAARDILLNLAQSLDSDGGRALSIFEEKEGDLMGTAWEILKAVQGFELLGKAMMLIPDFAVHAHFWGIGPRADVGGGTKLGHVMRFAGEVAKAIADDQKHAAINTSRTGNFDRRGHDFAFQSNNTANEITQIHKQIRAAELRQAVAERELDSHRTLMKHAAEIEGYLNEEGTNKNGKKTSRALYAWMKREVRGLYSQAFQFAFDVSRKAERALQHELGKPDLTFLQYGYLAGKEGLLAGEKLHLDLKRMEMAYHDLNQREYELTKHVSLLQLEPMALLQLRMTGRCTVTLPEALFDLDGPGQYFRRLKTVAVSIPCVTGPYASVNCTLTLLKSSTRTSPVLRDGVYARDGAEDERFTDYFGSMQSIVTSMGTNDSGLFETNLRDERYLPFEGSGAVSEWQLQLPANPSKGDPQQFDYNTISDVLLHLRYTAREGGQLLRSGAMSELKTAISETRAPGSVRLFSVRQDFPSEWARFKGDPAVANRRFTLSLPLRAEHYPYWSQGRLSHITRVDLLARTTKPSLDVFDRADQNDPASNKDALAKLPAMGGLVTGRFANIPLPATPTGTVTLCFEDRAIDDLWLMVGWNDE